MLWVCDYTDQECAVYVTSTRSKTTVDKCQFYYRLTLQECCILLQTAFRYFNNFRRLHPKHLTTGNRRLAPRPSSFAQRSHTAFCCRKPMLYGRTSTMLKHGLALDLRRKNTLIQTYIHADRHTYTP